MAVTKHVEALGNKIKSIKKGSVTPTGLAKGQEAGTPQKVKVGTAPGVAYSNGGRIRPQRG